MTETELKRQRIKSIVEQTSPCPTLLQRILRALLKALEQRQRPPD